MSDDKPYHSGEFWVTSPLGAIAATPPPPLPGAAPGIWLFAPGGEPSSPPTSSSPLAAAAFPAPPLPAPPAPPSPMAYLQVADTVCGCVRRRHPLRRAALIVARSRLFDAFILLNIFVNFGLLAAEDPTMEGSPAERVRTLLEPWFAALYWFEALAKILALGPRGYFNDGWCAFDFSVVALCTIALIPGVNNNASGIRTLRALRPLRALGRYPSLRRTVGGVLAATSATVRFDFLNYAVVFVFALCAMQLWGGDLEGACAYQLEPLAAGGGGRGAFVGLARGGRGNDSAPAANGSAPPPPPGATG